MKKKEPSDILEAFHPLHSLKAVKIRQEAAAAWLIALLLIFQGWLNAQIIINHPVPIGATFEYSTTVTIPEGVTSINILAWGGGAGGNGNLGLPPQMIVGGGGGTFSRVENIPVTPGEVLNVQIGRGGTVLASGGFSNTGLSGGNTSVSRGSTNLVLACGGPRYYVIAGNYEFQSCVPVSNAEAGVKTYTAFGGNAGGISSGGGTGGVPGFPGNVPGGGGGAGVGGQLAGAGASGRVIIEAGSPGPTCNFLLTASSDTICAGERTNIRANEALSYAWSPATGLSADTGAVVSAGPSVTTTYTVTGTKGGCSSQQQITIHVLPKPLISVSPSEKTLCEGESVQLTASGASSYNWTPETGLSGTTGSNVTANPSTTTTYTVIGSSGSCSDTAIVSVTVQAKPQITVSPLVRGICSGNRITLTASGAENYSWSPLTGLNAGTGEQVVASPAVTTTYTVTGTTNGCSGTASIPLVVFPLPQVVANAFPASAAVCNGAPVRLFGSGALTYTWSDGVTNNVPFVPATSYTYNVTGTDANGCSNTATIAVQVNNLPDLPGAISGPSALCGLTAATYTVSTVPGASSYNWILPAGLSGSSATNSITVSINQVLFNGGNISVSASNGSCTGPARVRTLTKALPAPSSITGPTNICGLTSATFTASPVTGATSYNWLLPGGLTGNSNTNTITVAINASGFSGGSISVAAVNDCGAGSYRSVTLGSRPAAPGSISGPVSLCGLTTATYQVNQASGVTGYSWTLPAGLSGSSGSNTINVSINPSQFQGGNIQVSAINACGTSQPRNLKLDDAPPIPGTISGPSVLCGITTANYSVNPVPGASSYSWTLPGGLSGSSSSNAITVQVAADQFTGGAITVKANNSCGSGGIRSKTLSTTPVQTGLITGPVILCGLTIASYSISAVSGATAYTWNLPQGLSGISVNNVINVTIDPAVFKGGEISVNVSNACGAGSASKLSLRTSLSIPGSISGPRDGVCAGSTQSYTCSPVSGASSYDWTVPAGAQVTSGQGTTSVTVSFPTPFVSGSLSVAALNECGRSNPRTITVRSVPAAPLSVTGPGSNLCGGGTFTYSVSPVNGATSYNWTVPAGCSISGNATGNSIGLVVPSGFNNGQLSVRAQNSCGSSNPATLNLNALPATSGVIIGPASVCANQQGVVFSTIPVSGVSSFEWSVPAGAQIVSGQGTASITVNWGGSSGNVSVFAKNNCGNGLTRSRNITINCREAEAAPAAIVAEKPEALIYPNPARELVNIRLSDETFNRAISYRIFNMAGQLIAQARITQPEFVLDRSAIRQPGIYFIQFADSNGNMIVTERISITD